MLTLVLLASTATLPVELYPVEKLSLLPRAELRVHLHDVEDELLELRRPFGVSEVLEQAGTQVAPFLLMTGLPILAAGVIFGKFDVTPLVLLFGALPLAVGLVAALVYAVGSVIEFVLVGRPARLEREATLTAYRATVASTLETQPR